MAWKDLASDIAEEFSGLSVYQLRDAQVQDRAAMNADSVTRKKEWLLAVRKAAPHDAHAAEKLEAHRRRRREYKAHRYATDPLYRAKEKARSARHAR